MDDLIPLINKLQSVFKTAGSQEIKLPQIVVIGPQSSGKSSVLESLVKKSFLPRGEGIATRCPIILQLNQLPDSPKNTIGKNKNKEPNEWCRFPKMDDQDKKYTDFNEVRKKIEELQKQITRSDKGISKEPIILEIHSPNVINLTVVDLPGIVKIAVKGQPENIEEQVNELIMDHIKTDTAIILAVSSATADIATSDSIKMAKKVDPGGERTIAVITKLDMMGEGTNATSVLQGDLIKVKLGIIGVVNRGESDIQKQTTVEEALRKEREFLQAKYPHINGIGSAYLARKLNKLLKNHIQTNLPELIERIDKLCSSCEDKLKILGQELPTDEQDKCWIIMETASNFVKKLQETIQVRQLEPKKLNEEVFAVSVNDSFQRLKDNIVITEIEVEKLQDALRKTLNFEGYASIEEVFKFVVKERIIEMQKPAIICAKEIHDILSFTAGNCLDDNRLQSLNDSIKRVVDGILEIQLKIVENGIEEYIKIQVGMIASSDEGFANLLSEGPDASKLKMATQIINKSGFHQQEITETFTSFPVCIRNEFLNGSSKTSYVKNLIHKYLTVLKREMSDYIPKYIMYHLANQTVEKITNGIKNSTRGKESILVSESEDTTMERKREQIMLKNLKEAKEVIKEIHTS